MMTVRAQQLAIWAHFWLTRVTSPEVLDLLFAVLSVAIVTIYYFWYYSWRLHPYRRLAGQHAREIFTRALLTDPSDAAANIAIQAARNPITAASILATGASVGATTIINIVLDGGKMEKIRTMNIDPLTGGSGIIPPEIKMGSAAGILLVVFFALAQSLRLFVHLGFMLKASTYCQNNDSLGVPHEVDCLKEETVKVCLRAQLFFSLGLRGLYLFLPLVAWAMGGTFLLLSTVLVITAQYFFDQI